MQKFHIQLKKREAMSALHWASCSAWHLEGSYHPTQLYLVLPF